MTKEDYKKAIVTGAVMGVVGAITGFLLIWAYIEIPIWYRSYRANHGTNYSHSHCVMSASTQKDSIDCTPDSILDD